MKDENVIYNYYAAESPEASRFKAASSDLFAGRKQQVSFPWTSTSRLPFQETWTRLGREETSINGRKINTQVFELERNSTTASNDWHGKWRILYDPATSVYVKGTITLLSQGGNRHGNSWEYSEIVVP